MAEQLYTLKIEAQGIPLWDDEKKLKDLEALLKFTMPRILELALSSIDHGEWAHTHIELNKVSPTQEIKS